MFLKFSILLVAGSIIFHEIESRSKPKKDTQNNPPEVKIIKPSAGLTLKQDMLVPFEIEVADQEDGKSEYDEINSNEVILQIQYASDSNQVIEYLGASNQEIPAGLKWISRSNCFNCHRPNSTLIGPSFRDIAKKYEDSKNTTEYLVGKMIAGSKGIWGDLEMPPNPELSRQRATEMMEWIFEAGIKDDQTHYVGSVGSFKTRVKPPTGMKAYAVLTALYHDHAPDDQGLTGRHTLVLAAGN